MGKMHIHLYLLCFKTASHAAVFDSLEELI